MAAKFHERFDIEVGLDEARRRFVNRAHDLAYRDFWSKHRDSGVMAHAWKAVAFALGDEWKGRLDQQVGRDFFRNVQALEALYRSFTDETMRKDLEDLIQRLLDESEVDLGIRWENGQFINSGATLLDETLVNDPLRWLRSSGYKTVLTPFEKGLNHFLHASKQPGLLVDVVTDMYESLEALAKIVTERDRDLSATREIFLAKVKASDEYKQILKDYISYANRFRHAERKDQPRPQLSSKEVESFVYLTGVFIRLAMPPS
jgi:hypothetical protein